MPDTTHTVLGIDTPLSGDVALEDLSGEEAISSLYEFHATILSDQDSLKPTDIVGEFVCCRIDYAEQDTRHFNGFVSRVGQGDTTGDGGRRYYLTIVPWFWFLTQTSNCKIFQNMTVPDIVKAIFEEYGFKDFKDEISRSYAEREFVVQYNESAFNFVSRLLEEEGIFYFFVFEKNRHVMVLSDDVSSFQACSKTNVEYRPDSNGAGCILSWRHEYKFVTGGFAHTDYNPLTANVKLLTSTKSKADFPKAKNLEKFEYPGRYEDKGRGDQLALTRMEADEACLDTAAGDGGFAPFTAGQTFAFDSKWAPPGTSGRYVLTSVRHHMRAQFRGSNAGTNVVYTNKFTCAPATIPFRPQRVTPKPRAIGPHTAVVVGPSGEEVYTDEYGRIKVQFPWDRDGQNDENSGCYLRVVQSLAGPSFGAMMLPRIGMEVLVEFEDGDLDRPRVMGAVYNSQNRPPYDPNANKGWNGFESRSTKNGSKETANILRFEDTKDEERLYIHAQKDMVSEVEHDVKTTIDNNRTETVGGNETVTIKGDRKEEIGKRHDLSVGEDQVIYVEGMRETQVIGDCRDSFSANSYVDVSQDHEMTVNGSMNLSVSQDLKIEAGTSIELVVGGNSVKLTASGIEIKGMNVSQEATSNVTIEGLNIKQTAKVNAETQAAIVKLAGSGMVQVQSGGIATLNGALLKIN